jgi:apolipoprotein N-acyltransferase
MKKTAIASIILLTALISGCGQFGTSPVEEIKVVTVSVPVEIFQPPMPAGVKLENIKWHVITKDNANEKIAEIEKHLGGEFVVFAMTPQSYENMSYNIQELKRFIQEQAEIIIYYREATRVKNSETTTENIN